jgi:metal-responsive CopG/Arc/MetJ family transcriptional regulator
MSALKKGTKLTNNPKDYMLRVRLDGKTLEKLDAVCEVNHISRSEAVRQGIDEQFQKAVK